MSELLFSRKLAHNAAGRERFLQLASATRAVRSPEARASVLPSEHGVHGARQRVSSVLSFLSFYRGGSILGRCPVFSSYPTARRPLILLCVLLLCLLLLRPLLLSATPRKFLSPGLFCRLSRRCEYQNGHPAVRPSPAFRRAQMNRALRARPRPQTRCRYLQRSASRFHRQRQQKCLHASRLNA